MRLFTIKFSGSEFLGVEPSRYIDIIFPIAATTTQGIVTSDLHSETPSTSIRNNTAPVSTSFVANTSDSGGLSSGAIAGLIIGLILSLLLGAAIVAVVVALILMKYRQNKGKYSTNKEHALGMTLCSNTYSNYNIYVDLSVDLHDETHYNRCTC